MRLYIRIELHSLQLPLLIIIIIIIIIMFSFIKTTWHWQNSVCDLLSSLYAHCYAFWLDNLAKGSTATVALHSFGLTCMQEICNMVRKQITTSLPRNTDKTKNAHFLPLTSSSACTTCTPTSLIA